MLCKAEWTLLDKPVIRPALKDGVYHALTKDVTESIIFGDDLLLSYNFSLDVEDQQKQCPPIVANEDHDEDKPKEALKSKRTCIIC